MKLRSLRKIYLLEILREVAYLDLKCFTDFICDRTRSGHCVEMSSSGLPKGSKKPPCEILINFSGTVNGALIQDHTVRP